MPEPNYAVIDIGTLKVKTEIASISPDNTINRLYNSNILTCFGVGLAENNGNAKEEYIERTIKELKRVKAVMQIYDVTKFKIVSTHAMRRANNREYILDKIKHETNFDIDNITQQQEAELFFKAVMRTFPKTTQEYAVVDVGGGSVQILIGTPNNLRTFHMMQTGAQVLHEQFTKNPHDRSSFNTSEDIENMKQRILEELIHLEKDQHIPIVYGSSMIIDIMKQINLPLEEHTASPTHPYKTYAKHLNNFINQILPYTFGEREQHYQDMPTGFIWGIDKGFITISTLAEHLDSPYIIPTNANIAQGIIYSLTQ